MNIVCGFVYSYFVFLLDELIVSFDVINCEIVLGLIEEVKVNGIVIVGIFYDEVVCEWVCDCEIDVMGFSFLVVV